jgi:signal transduction histidine kinase
LLVVPLMVKDDIYGALALYYRQPHEFTREETELAVAFGDQAALAIENARLRTQAEQMAVAAERNRLARDLHDAVTQTLFSTSLIADVLPRLWERDRNEAWRRLGELRQLTRGALAEMRTLLLELRPATLTEVGIDELLRQLTEAITGQARVPITLTVDGQCRLPPDVQIALYRIAQEALNNVARHANASQVAVCLQCRADQIELRISDDGQGFEPSRAALEHLGLGIMRERAETIGAALQIESQPGFGTQVAITWPQVSIADERLPARATPLPLPSFVLANGGAYE